MQSKDKHTGGNDEAVSPSQLEILKRAVEIFYESHPDDRIHILLDEIIEDTPPLLANIAEAFKHSVEAVVSTVCMPLTIANNASRYRLWTQVLSSERIQALIDETEGNPVTETEVLERAAAHLDSHLSDHKARTELTVQACDFILTVHKDPTVQQAAPELLRQGLILLWSALEALARDLFVSIVNAKPQCARALAHPPDGKQVLAIKKLDFEILADFEFDLSKSMGDLLIRYCDMSNLTVIRRVFACLTPDSTRLLTQLGRQDLWTMNQRRHLMVHRSGLVDSRYIELTGDKAPVRARLEITTSAFRAYVKLVTRTGQMWTSPDSVDTS